MADPARKRTFRCAIYARKSSEEGLEQDFNSLHAQREACEAFIASQKHEGWKALPTAYDDGGYSGGSMERPGLQALLADIAAGSIDVVVVYKVDRLTRALSDFARIVEVFDRHGVSFVSVTQAFNTTTSMGRLTLNVLLSFAQFEREVTGERIRDKIAASKKKGLWMGGHVPLGYAAAGRTLTIRDDEAGTIRTIYGRYLELRSVDRLAQDLDRRGLKTRLRPNGSAQMSGGKPFTRGHLYRILSNPLYAGRIEHKGEVHEGQHPAIIDRATWDAVQALLAANSHQQLVKTRSRNPSLLAGLLFEGNGQRLIASHSVKQGKRYRYYITPPTKRPDAADEAAPATALRKRGRSTLRIPAGEVEGAVLRLLTASLTNAQWRADHLHGPDTPVASRRVVEANAVALADRLGDTDPIDQRGLILMLVERVTLDRDTISVVIRTGPLIAAAGAAGDSVADGHALSETTPSVTVTRPFVWRRRGGDVRLIIEGDSEAEPERDPALIKGLSQAHRWWRDLIEQRYPTFRALAAAYGIDERFAAWVTRLAFLPASLIRQILDGTQPADLTLARLIKMNDAEIMALGARGSV
jgi:DNA invertase Pin-like site-specific DNA recombinase